MSLHYATMADEDLMRFIQAKDVKAFDTIVARHHGRFYSMVYRWVLNQEDAEDIVQLALLKLWSGKARFKAGKGAKFTTWFYRVLYNQAMDVLRAGRRQFVDVEDVVLKSTDNLEMTAIEKDRQKQIYEALNTLPESQRVAISMVYFEELPQKQIAQMLGISLKARIAIVTC